MRVLIAGLGDHKDFGLKSLRDAGCFVGVIDLPHRVPVNLVDWWRAGDRFSADSMLEAADSADFAWDAVLCWEELSTDVARTVARKLGVPGPRMPDGHFRDKGLMHGRLRELGLPTPQLGVAETPEACEQLAAGRFPVVVKPTDYGGSGGVSVVTEAAKLTEGFRAAAALSASGRVAVDRYIRGPEYSVEAVTWAPGETEILAIVEKRLTRPPFCVELGHLVPAPLEPDAREALAVATARILDALGMEAGVCHAEFRLTPEGPMLMEVAGRPAGGQIPRLVELATGWNINRAELAAVTGTRIGPGAAAEPFAAVRWFVGDGETPFSHPVTLENASRAPLLGTLRELRYFTGEGVVRRRPRGPEDRLGYAVFAGGRERIDAALSLLDQGEEAYHGE
jgi:biotin carboxylase